MVTIEHCDSVVIQLAGEKEQRTILGAALEAALRSESAPLHVRTSATPPAHGEVWPGEGGRYGATMPTLGGKPGWHIIIVDVPLEKLTWGPYDHDVTGAADSHDGLANTRALQQDAKEHPVARWVGGLQADGHEDCYIASQAEAQLLRVCVPHLFKPGYHWTSTQSSPYYAWVQGFEYGYSGIRSKGNEFPAVVVRRLAL